MKLSTNLIFLTLSSLCACSPDAGGHSYDFVRVEAVVASSDAEQNAPVSASECIAIPVLHGSRLVQNIEVTGDLTAEIQATNFEVVLIVRGSTDGKRTYAVDDSHGLLGGGVTDGVTVDGFIVYPTGC